MRCVSEVGWEEACTERFLMDDLDNQHVHTHASHHEHIASHHEHITSHQITHHPTST